jgi:hypothetical protein
MAAEALQAIGFVAEVDTTSPEPPVSTTVAYAPGSEEAARIVARHLTSQATFVVDESLEVNQVVLTTGPDFTTVVREPWSATDVPGPTTTTTTTPATSTTDPGETTTTAEPPTTTTVIGVIPDAPPAGEEC